MLRYLLPWLCQHQYAEAPCRLLVQDLCLQLTKVTPPPQHIHVLRILGPFPHCLSIDDICFNRILFTFLTKETSDSSFWKFSFKCLIYAVSEAIVELVCSWVLRNKLIIWFLFNALSVSSVYSPAITSTRLLQWQKNSS